MDNQADWRSHPISGLARAAEEKGEDGSFSCPLISEITENLWMGGCLHAIKLDDDFTHVISLYPWEKYQLGEATKREEFKLYDQGEIPDVGQLHSIANKINKYRKQGKVLVHCFLPGTLIGGLTPVEIEDADEVLSHDGRIHKVTYHHVDEYVGDTRVIKTTGALDVHCTPEHPFQVFRPYYFPKGFKAKPGMASLDSVSTVVEHNQTQPVWLKAKDIQIGDYLVSSKLQNYESQEMGWPNNTVVLNPLLPSKDVAWMLGFYAADGSTCGANSISFTLSPTDDLDRLISVWESIGLTPKVTQYENYIRVVINSNVVSSAMREWFGKSDSKKLPEFIFTHGFPLESVIEGYAEGDGYEEISGTVTCHSISRTLIEQVRMALVSIGQSPTVSPVRRHSGYSNAKPCYKVQWNPNATQHHTAWFNDMYLLPVTGLEIEQYSGLVYNLAVDDSETYTVNGVNVHNCQAGLNRSGLLTGLALVLDGMAPVDAIALLRRQRSPMVLCNDVFENWLLNYQPAGNIEEEND